MPFDELPTDAQRDFLLLDNTARRETGKVFEVARIEKRIGIVLCDQQARDGVPRTRRFVRQCTDGLLRGYTTCLWLG